MKRSAPMKRSGFKPKHPPRPVKTLHSYTPRPRLVLVGRPAANADRFVPQPKEVALQHGGYMAAVRRLACARCGHPPPSQFCHADEGKGTGIKTDCRRGWPGCGPHGGEPGCHWLVGTSGRIPKAERREFEARAGVETRAEVVARGQWPKRLPPWPGDAKTSEGKAA